MTEKLNYTVIVPRTCAELEERLRSPDPNTVCDALYSAAQHEPNWRWSQEQCLRMLQHESPLVRTAALFALGEIAIFRGQIDADVVLPIVRRFKSDPAHALSAEQAINDIEALGTRDTE